MGIGKGSGRGGARPNTGRKRKTLPATMISDAMDQLAELVKKGDMQAIRLVVERHIPVLRAVSTGIDAKLVEAKIHEITVLADRIAALEETLKRGE